MLDHRLSSNLMGVMMGKYKRPVPEKVAATLAKSEGMHAIGGAPGLYLRVNDGCSWILRYSFAGRRRDLGLGSYRDLTLAQARETAQEHRALIRKGIDPIETRRQERSTRQRATAKRVTFAQCVDGFLQAHSYAWRNAKHRAQWRSSLETYAGPVIGQMDVGAVDTNHILKILEPIWQTKTQTATRLRGRIENVLSWATVRGYRSGQNPARWKGHLDQLLARVSSVLKVTHHPALPFVEIGAFMTDLRQQEGIAAQALEFCILTAARTGEVRGAKWAEFDLTERVWTVPAERMKANKEHRVPLS